MKNNVALTIFISVPPKCYRQDSGITPELTGEQSR
jgi:hypothetical protein